MGPAGQAAGILARGISAILVGVVCVFLDRWQIVTLIVVLGQGHFCATYYFQYRAGKINRWYIARYATAVITLSALFLVQLRLAELFVFSSIYFVIHFIRDEKFLFGDKPSFYHSLDILPVILGYSGILIEMGMYAVEPDLLMNHNGRIESGPALFFMLAAGVIFLFKVVLSIKKSDFGSASSIYFSCGSIGLFVLYASRIQFTAEQFMGFIILFHYLNWYHHYFFRFSEKPAQLKTYVRRVVIINLLVLGLYFLIGRHPQLPVPASFFFFPYLFYLWTVLHLVATEREKDFAFWIPGKGLFK